MANLNGKNPQQIAKEIMEELPSTKIEQLAKEMGVTYEKALSVVKAEQRARDYRKKQQELQKAARKAPSWKKIFENCDKF
jgi:polysaccharide deacetylase 2 family uncharacterized protein YibQ